MWSYKIHLQKLQRGPVTTCDLDIISVIKEGTYVGLPAVAYSPRLIIIIFMSKHEDLLALFTAMTPKAIKKYPLPHTGSLRRTRTNYLPSSTRISMTPSLTNTSLYISITVLHHTEPSFGVACPSSSGRQPLVPVAFQFRVETRGKVRRG